MQKKEQKYSPIKQRILQFAESLGISKRDFYNHIGVSRGTLEAKNGITEDVMAKFIAAYPTVSLNWLITGEGSMFNEKLPEGDFSAKEKIASMDPHLAISSEVTATDVNAPGSVLDKRSEDFIQIIKEQQNTITDQQRTISEMSSTINILAKRGDAGTVTGAVSRAASE